MRVTFKAGAGEVANLRLPREDDESLVCTRRGAAIDLALVEGAAPLATYAWQPYLLSMPLKEDRRMNLTLDLRVDPYDV